MRTADTRTRTVRRPSWCPGRRYADRPAWSGPPSSRTTTTRPAGHGHGPRRGDRPGSWSSPMRSRHPRLRPRRPPSCPASAPRRRRTTRRRTRTRSRSAVSELQAERPASAEDLAAPPRRRAPVAFVRGQLRETHVQLLASQVLMGCVAMAANVLMARALSPTGRGEVALILQIVYLATQVLLLGTERSFIAGYHGVAPAAAVRAYARLLIVPSAVALIGGAAFAAIAPDRFNPGPGVIALIACYAITEAVILGTRAI